MPVNAERRGQHWRMTCGPAREAMFRQVHQEGDLAASDFTETSSLRVTIAGQRLKHLAYHFVLTCSNWETVTLCPSESFEVLSDSLQNASGNGEARRSSNVATAEAPRSTASRRSGSFGLGMRLNRYGVGSGSTCVIRRTAIRSRHTINPKPRWIGPWNCVAVGTSPAATTTRRSCGKCWTAEHGPPRASRRRGRVAPPAPRSESGESSVSGGDRGPSTAWCIATGTPAGRSGRAVGMVMFCLLSRKKEQAVLSRSPSLSALESFGTVLRQLGSLSRLRQGGGRFARRFHPRGSQRPGRSPTRW